jgi:putative hydrolase of the HAD superfamily
MYHERPARRRALLPAPVGKREDRRLAPDIATAGRVVYTMAHMASGFPDKIHTVTFDCWSTLIHEAPATGEKKLSGSERRAAQLARLLGVDQPLAAAAFSQAWALHQQQWHRRVAFAAPDMLSHTLRVLEIELEPSRRAEILRELEEEILERGVSVIAGARELLALLRARGVRTALICDTGFTPGRVVRRLLDQHGLLGSLEVTIFSDEIGVPKPHPRAFVGALEGLGVQADGAVHVGDLRRSDVAGARAIGMGSVRFRGHHDDHVDASGSGAGVIDCAAAGCTPPCARPEADHVVDTYTALLSLLEHRIPAPTRE